MIIWKKIRTGEWIPWTYLLMLVFDLVYNSLVYCGGQWVGTHTKAWNIETSLDQQIPVIHSLFIYIQQSSVIII